MAELTYTASNDKAGMEELEKAEVTKADVTTGTVHRDDKQLTRKVLWKLDTRYAGRYVQWCCTITGRDQSSVSSSS